MGSTKAKTIHEYNELQSGSERKICAQLQTLIAKQLPEAESKIWHGGPVWFIKGNPIVSYTKQKAGIKLMFFSGAEFSEPQLRPGSGKYKDASMTYTEASQLNQDDLARWLAKARVIQYDYKNIIKRRGVLVRLD